MKTVVYARQSSGDEEDSASVEVQIQACTDYAKKQGMEVEVFSDTNTSGKTYPDLPDAVILSRSDSVYQTWHKSIGSRRNVYRKGLAGALNALEKADVFLFYDFTRVMRPLTDSFLESFLKQKIIASGVKVISLQEGELNLASFSTSLITSLQSRINDQQIAVTRAKSIAQLKKNRDEGLRISGSDFLGFKNAGKQKVVEVPEEIEMVKFIIEKVNAGFGIQMICRMFNEKFTNRGHDFWYQDIKKVCNRLEYAGKCLNSAGEIIDSKVFPVVIPLAELLKARERINNRRVINRDKKEIHPLSGLVFCGVCGERLKTAKTKSFPRSKDPFSFYFTHQQYHVKTMAENKRDCVQAQVRLHFSAVNKNGLEQIVLPLLAPMIEAEVKRLREKSDNSAEIRLQIEKIERLEKLLDKKMVEGEITEAEYEARFSEYSSQKKALKKQLVSASADPEPLIKELNEISLMITLGVKLAPNQFKMLAQQYIQKILLFPDFVEVHFLDGTIIKIDKVRMRNSRCFPEFMLHREKDKFLLELMYKGTERSTIFENEFIRINKIPL